MEKALIDLKILPNSLYYFFKRWMHMYRRGMLNIELKSIKILPFKLDE